MKKLMSFVCAALFAFSFCAVMPSNAFSADYGERKIHPTAGITAIGARMPLVAFNINLATSDVEVAKKIVELRDQLGSFQSYDDLNELELPKDQMDKLRWNTTIQGIASDCNC